MDILLSSIMRDVEAKSHLWYEVTNQVHEIYNSYPTQYALPPTSFDLDAEQTLWDIFSIFHGLLL